MSNPDLSLIRPAMVTYVILTIIASKLIVNEQKHLSNVYNAALKRKARQILYNPTHPLNDAFQKLPPGRRLKVSLANKNLFKKSFIPSAILILNAKF